MKDYYQVVISLMMLNKKYRAIADARSCVDAIRLAEVDCLNTHPIEKIMSASVEIISSEEAHRLVAQGWSVV